MIQAEIARCEARLGSVHADLIDTVREIYDRAEDMLPIGIPDRVRARSLEIFFQRARI